MLDTVILIAIFLLILPTLFKNLVGPLLIWRQQRIPAQPELPMLPTPQFLAKRSPSYHRLHHEALALGFEYCGSSSLDDPHSTASISLYFDASRRLAVSICAMTSTAVPEFDYAEVTQEYDDGTEINVSNSPQQGAYPIRAWKLNLRYPEVTQVAELVERHAKLRAYLKPRVTAKSGTKDQVWQAVAASIRREADDLHRRGFCHQAIDEDGKRRLTLWGACTMTWKIVPPGLWLWNTRNRWRAQRLLKRASGQ